MVEQLVEAAGVGRVVDDVAVSASDVNDYTNWFAVQSSACGQGNLQTDESRLGQRRRC